jgi:phosphoglycolate phosphatase-like HAD superfamily hydrolase
LKPIYIFDLDGTLAHIEHRVHHIQTSQKNYRAFFAACAQDEPCLSVLGVLKRLRKGGAEIWVWTGRSDEVVAETEEWLHRYGVFRSVPFLSWDPFKAPEMLRMRRAGDHRADDELKAEWLSEVEPPEYERLRIGGVFEDRARVVKMWRAAGIPCYQVAEGDF